MRDITLATIAHFALVRRRGDSKFAGCIGTWATHGLQLQNAVDEARLSRWLRGLIVYTCLVNQTLEPPWLRAAPKIRFFLREIKRKPVLSPQASFFLDKMRNWAQSQFMFVY